MPPKHGDVGRCGHWPRSPPKASTSPGSASRAWCPRWPRSTGAGSHGPRVFSTATAEARRSPGQTSGTPTRSCPTPGASSAGLHTNSPARTATGPRRRSPRTRSDGVPAIDTGTAICMGSMRRGTGWNDEVLDALHVTEGQLPVVVPMGQPAGTVTGSDTVLAAGTVDALCDQIVSGADRDRGRPRDLRGDTHRVGGGRRLGRGARIVDASPHRGREGPRGRTEQRRRTVRGLGPGHAPRRRPLVRPRLRGAATTTTATTAGDEPERSGDPGPGTGVDAVPAGRARAVSRHLVTSRPP